MAESIKDANQVKEFPQVAAGENPLHGVTDTSRGCEVTQEWEVKQGAGTRLSSPSLGGSPWALLNGIRIL